jgi:hypothetical protein
MLGAAAVGTCLATCQCGMNSSQPDFLFCAFEACGYSPYVTSSLVRE